MCLNGDLWVYAISNLFNFAFHQIRMFSAIISSNIILFPCCISSLLGLQLSLCWYDLWCPTGLLGSIHPFSLFFSFCSSDSIIPINLPLSQLILALLHQIYGWNPLGNFLFRLSHFSTSKFYLIPFNDFYPSIDILHCHISTTVILVSFTSFTIIFLSALNLSNM